MLLVLLDFCVVFLFCFVRLYSVTCDYFCLCLWIVYYGCFLCFLDRIYLFHILWPLVKKFLYILMPPWCIKLDSGCLLEFRKRSMGCYFCLDNLGVSVKFVFFNCFSIWKRLVSLWERFEIKWSDYVTFLCIPRTRTRFQTVFVIF